MQYPAEVMTPETTPTDPSVAYELVKNLIFDRVYSFLRTYYTEPCDFDDLISEAHLSFLKNHRQYITGFTATGLPCNESFCSHIATSIWFDLLDSIKKRARFHNEFEEDRYNEVCTGRAPTKAAFREWAGTLSGDAQAIIVVFLDPPEHVHEAAGQLNGTPRSYKHAVRCHLLVNGWSYRRIRKAFKEIKEALQ